MGSVDEVIRAMCSAPNGDWSRQLSQLLRVPRAEVHRLERLRDEGRGRTSLQRLLGAERTPDEGAVTVRPPSRL